ncbi:hypothetical protein BT96DRAFT_1006968 [Gymnopus androsaceus JB14]|uniref:SET domain-containing protein n=1 Tax=Gymnopus androsaceus JB14 TaxID=1447944 RepID=A0A6A4GJR6_9AGAR|nr:hypothetical protein BT96DRAFT_1006968 [Gymnopus androsaceus JB14]
MSGVEKLCLTSQSTLKPSPVDFSWSGSYFIPNSTLDRSQLRVLIAETRRNIEKCDLKDTRRVQLAKILEFQESLLSPIRTLPPENYSIEDTSSISICIHAVRDIPSGTEITIQYCDILDPAAERAKALAPQARFKDPIKFSPKPSKPGEPPDAWAQPAPTRLQELEVENLQAVRKSCRTLFQLVNIHAFLLDIQKVLCYAKKLKAVYKVKVEELGRKTPTAVVFM